MQLQIKSAVSETHEQGINNDQIIIIYQRILLRFKKKKKKELKLNFFSILSEIICFSPIAQQHISHMISPQDHRVRFHLHQQLRFHLPQRVLDFFQT